ncbi:trans-sialidase, putative [Trypanosoma cruzi marinkellei]|uniref:Trans-sialidase, putative n=1 Tax=Trypanosoma cruzi marinkellei TaxID=85056 RepID=K2NBJ3_TRYCR|nr:trans-sialidase, putative [Trypanosoma cruzi marinkellei]
MHSRVAAVKAPCTHNRRRVTGSSGRRREGRESEPQRPNMSRHFFYSAVLLLVVMWCGSGVVEKAAGQSSESQFAWRDANGDVTVDSLGAPSLLKVGNDVFAFAESQCKDGSEKLFNGIASQLLKTKTATAPEEVLNEANTRTQFLEEGTSQKKKVDVSRPTTVVKENEIYMLVGNYSQTAVAQETSAAGWGFLLVNGEVSGVSGTEKKIEWKNTNDVSRASLAEQLESWTWLIGGGGSGVHMGDGKLLFPVEGMIKKEGEPQKDEKAVSLIIYTLSGSTSWKLSNEMSDGGCSDPSVVEWEKGKLIMMTACDDGRRRVYESGDVGNLWTEALGTLSRVWDNPTEKTKRVRSGFITATIDGVDNRKVMLITLPVYAKEEKENGKGKLHLWLTDNTHIVDIGSVSGEEDEEIAVSSLLYKSAKGGNNNNKEELIALYEKKKEGGNKPSSLGLVSVLLTEQLQRVKEVLEIWKKVDESVSQLCPSLALESASSGTPCSSNFNITDGLVGFLYDNISGTTWKDEYLGVNATINNNKGGAKATKATVTSEKGVKFQGAWAEWPVGPQGENQLYHFANYNFTLLATVSIDGEPTQDGPIPLMGVKMSGNENKLLLGLSYVKKENKWELLCDGKSNSDKPSSTREAEKTYQVAIVLRNGNQGSAYVDGQPVGEAPCELENKKDKKISHFYIGGDGGSASGTVSQEGVSVTVSNVLLYNRPLDDTEIGALHPNKASIPFPVDRLSKGTTLHSSPGGRQEEQEQPLEIRAADSQGLSTTSLSTANTPSGEEGSVKEMASGESPDGTQSMDGVFLPDGEQRTGRGAGGTVKDGTAVNPEVDVSSRENGGTAGGTNGQEEEGIYQKDSDVNAAALSSNLGNLSQANNSDAGTVRESGMMPLPSLLLLLGLWGFAAL